MLRFDRLKIITNVQYISQIDYSKFDKCNKGDRLLYYKYKQDSPYLLLIKVDMEKSQLLIEFTGKILGDLYPELIHKDNILYCFEQINKLGICHLDGKSIIDDGLVGRCDVTKDVVLGDFNSLKGKIRKSLTNYKKWICKEYKSGIMIENTVVTKKYQKRIIIYDKAEELTKSLNIDFINSLSEPEQLLSYFADKVRLELNLSTFFQIKKILQIKSNTVKETLNSMANPLLQIIDEALLEDDTVLTKSFKNLRDYEHYLLLEKCEFDLQRVEGVLRDIVGIKYSLTRVMEPYRKLNSMCHPKENIKSQLRVVLA